MTEVATLANPASALRARSFTPPGDRNARLSHLDPRPLWREPRAVASPWRSPSFWFAALLVLPIAGIAKVARALG